MTKDQRVYLMADLWPAAAAKMGWRDDDRERRLDAISVALGRSVESANEIESNDDFTRVKNHLQAVAKHGSVRLETTPDLGASRRRKVLEQARCLCIYMSGSAPNAELYVKAVVADTAGRAGYEPEAFNAAPLARVLEHLSFEQLDRLVKTLDNRLHNKRTGFRVQAKHTIHDMLIKAGVPCRCHACLNPNQPF